MPESTQQMVHAQRQYSRELDENQNARLRKSNAAFHAAHHFAAPFPGSSTDVPGEQVTVVQAQAPPNVDYAPLAWSLLFLFVFFFALPGAFVLAVANRVRQRRRARQYSPGQPSSPALSYRAAPSLLTPTESQFYAALVEAVGPMAVIQCKVRLADLLLTAPHDLAAFRRVSQKHVDFVLCDRATLRPRVAVELDDHTHQREDRRRRDDFVDRAYAQAGLPLVHLPVQERYSAAQLLGELQQFL